MLFVLDGNLINLDNVEIIAATKEHQYPSGSNIHMISGRIIFTKMSVDEVYREIIRFTVEEEDL